MQSKNRATFLLLLLCLFAWPLCAQDKVAPQKYAKASDIPVEVFFRRAQYSDMALSPDGTKLAAVTPRNGRSNLTVIDLIAKKSTSLTNFSSSDVKSF